MRIIISAATILLLSGCGLHHYQCSSEQNKEVAERVELCTANGFTKSSCYRDAVKGQCTKDFKNLCSPGTDSCEISRLLDD